MWDANSTFAIEEEGRAVLSESVCCRRSAYWVSVIGKATEIVRIAVKRPPTDEPVIWNVIGQLREAQAGREEQESEQSVHGSVLDAQAGEADGQVVRDWSTG